MHSSSRFLFVFTSFQRVARVNNQENAPDCSELLLTFRFVPLQAYQNDQLGYMTLRVHYGNKISDKYSRAYSRSMTTQPSTLLNLPTDVESRCAQTTKK